MSEKHRRITDIMKPDEPAFTYVLDTKGAHLIAWKAWHQHPILLGGASVSTFPGQGAPFFLVSITVTRTVPLKKR